MVDRGRSLVLVLLDTVIIGVIVQNAQPRYNGVTPRLEQNPAMMKNALARAAKNLDYLVVGTWECD